jgi:alkylation response protein AidB-like acyl-CoA dehydrogenase
VRNLAHSTEAFREEVRAFLRRKLTAEIRAAAARQIGVFADAPLGRQWQRILYEQGWATPMWPTEHGGQGWTPLMKYAYDQECALADTPVPSTAGLLMCGPILILFGTREQQARFLPGLRSGADYWCQGYSEPNAGSDLARLACRARRDGDDYVVDGTKIWTTHAHFADWIFMLVRTSSDGKPQGGITFLLADMKSPGIKVDPIISMSGEHEVNQVFFDNVRVPASNRIGDENDGWNIAKRLLEFERSNCFGPRIRRILNRVERLAKAHGALCGQSAFWRRFAEVSIEAKIVEATELRMIAAADSAVTGVTTSLIKVTGTEAVQRATELAVLAGGARSAYAYEDGPCDTAVDEAAVSMGRYLNTRAATIYGGTSEVQRNIIARAMLGL